MLDTTDTPSPDDFEPTEADMQRTAAYLRITNPASALASAPLRAALRATARARARKAQQRAAADLKRRAANDND